MRRLFLGLVAVAALAACSDRTPTGTRPSGPDLRIRTDQVTPSGTLDEEIKAIIAFWGGGQTVDLLAKWETIKKMFGDGSNPAAVEQAIKKLFETAKHVAKVTPKMDDPPTDESPEAAAARLVTYMSLYIFSGPETDPPPYDPEANSAVGVLTPNSSLDLNAGGQAAAHFDKGSVDNDRVIVITQFPNNWDGPCDGPLETNLCQYPLYFDISSYPDGPLLKLATAVVCHPPVGAVGGPEDEDVHARLRLAHTRPDDEANYAPGGIITGTGDGENIEILPLVSQTLIPECEGTTYTPPFVEDASLLQRGVRYASAFASRVVKLMTPKSAYAADQGGGGEFGDFSPFNNVDADGYLAPTGPTGPPID